MPRVAKFSMTSSSSSLSCATSAGVKTPRRRRIAVLVVEVHLILGQLLRLLRSGQRDGHREPPFVPLALSMPDHYTPYLSEGLVALGCSRVYWQEGGRDSNRWIRSTTSQGASGHAWPRGRDGGPRRPASGRRGGERRRRPRARPGRPPAGPGAGPGGPRGGPAPLQGAPRGPPRPHRRPGRGLQPGRLRGPGRRGRPAPLPRDGRQRGGLRQGHRPPEPGRLALGGRPPRPREQRRRPHPGLPGRRGDERLLRGLLHALQRQGPGVSSAGCGPTAPATSPPWPAATRTTPAT